ncbi:ester cyclase [Nakamurella endophytica]|uniref:ester cyclase n=1 Tax=Nakamurella endophytica TaxID=1748367 RepID=UPI00166DC3FB|nr:ester cyclase [Nakamurella endophytica]
MDAAALAREFLAELGRQDWDRLDRLCRPDYVHHAPRVARASLAEYRQVATAMFSAFPDMTVRVEQLVPAGEWVTARYVATGTQTGPFHGIPPTGRTVSLSVLALLRLSGDLFAEGWFEFDSGELVERLTQAAAGAGPARS